MKFPDFVRAPEGGGAGDPPAGATGGSGGAADGEAGGTPPAPSAAYFPEGLPDNMRGANDKETMDKMAKGLLGYRTRDAERQVPADPAAYAAFDLEKVDEKLRGQIGELAKQPELAPVWKKAHELGIPAADVQALTIELFKGYDAAGLLDVTFDPAAERAALLPESAKGLGKAEQDAAIDARLNANAAFLDLAVKNGEGKPNGLTREVADYAQAMLGDAALGNRFLEWASGLISGGGAAQPFAGQGAAAGGDPRAALKARLNAPEMSPNHPAFSRAAYDSLMTDYQKLLG